MSNYITMVEPAAGSKISGFKEDKLEHKFVFENKTRAGEANSVSVEKIAAQLNELMRELDTKLSFAVDQTTNQIVIRVMNTSTNELIRQIPAEDMLRIAGRIKEMLGVVFDKVV